MRRLDLEGRCFRVSAIVVLSLGLMAPAVFGQQARSTIGGMVFDSHRVPITQVIVELLNDTNSVLQRTKTDAAGRYLFKALYSGRFVVRVLPLGTNFEEQSFETEIAGIGPDGRQMPDNVQLDFQLRVRRTASDTMAVNGVVFAQDIPAEARKSYEAGIAAIDSKQIEAGTKALENAVSIFPNYYLALLRLGLVYIGEQKFDKAKDAFTAAVTVNDRSFSGWYGLSYADFSMNQLPEAAAAAQKALVQDKNSVVALFLLGVTQRRLKNYVDAEKTLQLAKRIDNGKTPEISWNLALLYAHNLKQYKNAADELETYLKLVPEEPNKDKIKKLIKKFRDDAAAGTAEKNS